MLNAYQSVSRSFYIHLIINTTIFNYYYINQHKIVENQCFISFLGLLTMQIKITQSCTNL